MTEVPPTGDSPDISGLRAALAARADLPESLRSLFRRDFALWSALLAVSVRMRLGGSPDAPGLPGFIERAVAECDQEGVLVTRAQADILIRSNLGVVDVSGFDPASFDVPSAQQVLLATLLGEWQPAGEELDELLTRTADLRSVILTYMPEAALVGEMVDDLTSGTLTPEREAALETELGPAGQLSAFADSDSFPEQYGRYRKLVIQRVMERGAQLRDQGDVTGAITAYQEVAECGDPELVPHAAFELGKLLAQAGDIGRAQAMFERAAQSDHPQWSTAALFFQALILERTTRDAPGARAVLRRVAESADTTYGPMAVLELTKMVSESGDIDAARSLLELTVTTADTAVAARAAFHAGNALAKAKNVTGARTAFERAITLGDAEYAPRAAFNLGLMLEGHRDRPGAIAAYRLAAQSGHAEAAPRAAASLGHQLELAGDSTGAIAAFRQACASGDPEEVPQASAHLGELLAAAGDAAAARAAYQRAIDSGEQQWTMVATKLLADLLAREGELDEAIAAYRRVLDSGDGWGVPLAALGLGRALQQAGDVKGAKSAYKRALRAGPPPVQQQAIQGIRSLPKPPLNPTAGPRQPQQARGRGRRRR